jgi:hypothetical protein
MPSWSVLKKYWLKLKMPSGITHKKNRKNIIPDNKKTIIVSKFLFIINV